MVFIKDDELYFRRAASIGQNEAAFVHPHNGAYAPFSCTRLKKYSERKLHPCTQLDGTLRLTCARHKNRVHLINALTGRAHHYDFYDVL